MSLTVIPTLTDGTTAYRIRLRLEEQDWLFDFVYSARRDRWCMSILTLDGAPVLTGQMVVCGPPLLARAQGGPPGQIVATSADGTYRAPGLRELGNRVIVQYVSSDDELLAG